MGPKISAPTGSRERAGSGWIRADSAIRWLAVAGPTTADRRSIRPLPRPAASPSGFPIEKGIFTDADVYADRRVARGLGRDPDGGRRGDGAGRDVALVGGQASAARRPSRRGQPDRGGQRGAPVRDRADPGHGTVERVLPGERPGLGVADHRRAGESGLREPGGGGRPGVARRLRRADGPLRAGEQRGPLRDQG